MSEIGQISQTGWGEEGLGTGFPSMHVVHGSGNELKGKSFAAEKESG